MLLKWSLGTLIMFVCCWVGCSAYGKSGLSATAKPKPIIDPDATFECHRREYTYKAVRSDLSGRQCWEYITVMSCWGRCDSGEIADWKFPYKRSFHPVCIHDKKRIRRIRLKHCDIGAPPDLKYYEYFEAQSCVCQFCQTSTASCEGVPAIAK